jgi:hypothetical protein
MQECKITMKTLERWSKSKENLEDQKAVKIGRFMIKNKCSREEAIKRLKLK